MRKIIILSALVLTATAALAKNLKTIVVTTTPQMHCESCENRIKHNIRFEKGVKKIETSIPDQTVTITYDADKGTVENILNGFRKFDYTARLLKEGEKVKADESGQCPNM